VLLPHLERVEGVTGSPFLQKEVWQRAGHLTWTQYAAANNTRCDTLITTQRESEGSLCYVLFLIPILGDGMCTVKKVTDWKLKGCRL